MSGSLGLFLLIFSAIVLGWALGRFGPPWRRRESDDRRSGEYYRGLNYLLNDQPDEAINAFIDSLAVNEDTLETHLAVGNLMRRKGEVDKAIRVHQNLLARPGLGEGHLHRAHLELARDFMSAGLLDRAERLLQDLLRQSGELRETSLRHLLEIYQDEREWQKAIDAARQLLPRGSLLRPLDGPGRSLQATLAQYHCELAEQAIGRGDFPAARAALKQALARDRDCARASLLLGQVELEEGAHRQALRVLRRVRQQDPTRLGEVLAPLRAACEGAGRPGEYGVFLRECLLEYPSTMLMLALSEDVHAREGPAAAVRCLTQLLRQRPTLRGVARLIELRRQEGDAGDDSLALLQTLVQQLLSIKPIYQCHHCGFSGRNLHWHCPSCKQWDTIRPIRGVEGD